MIMFFACATFFLIIFSVIEFLSRILSIPREFSRKTTHILAGCSAAFLPYFISFGSIITLSLLFIVVMFISRKLKLFRSIHDVKRRSYGEFFFPLSIGITALLFPVPSIFMYGLLIMALGDGLAGLIGSHYSKRTYHLGAAHKSYLGSIVFFVVSLLIGLFFGPVLAIIGVTILLTLLEAICTRGLDNLFLPPVAALLLTLIT